MVLLMRRAGETASSLPDFDHPLEMLVACHERIKAQCNTLERLAGHMKLNGCDAQAQQAASNVLRYFDSAGRHHHEDEEEDLFPRMIAAAHGQNAERVVLLIEQLKREHRDMDAVWSRLRETLECIAHGEHAPLDALEVSRFRGTYQAHIAVEEANLIPLATLLLDADALADIGKAMARRRGVR